MPDPRSKWALTQTALDALLAALDRDRDAAGLLYETLRSRLVKYFEWRSCPDPEAQADTTFNRVARNLEAGEAIRDLPSYCLGVARLVRLEAIRADARERTTFRDLPPQAELTSQPAEELHCFEECFATLPEGARNMIVEYYRDEQRAKIERRKTLAAGLGIPLNALRIRAHRTRASLQKCISECLERRES